MSATPITSLMYHRDSPMPSQKPTRITWLRRMPEESWSNQTSPRNFSSVSHANEPTKNKSVAMRPKIASHTATRLKAVLFKVYSFDLVFVSAGQHLILTLKRVVRDYCCAHRVLLWT